MWRSPLGDSAVSSPGVLDAVKPLAFVVSSRVEHLSELKLCLWASRYGNMKAIHTDGPVS